MTKRLKNQKNAFKGFRSLFLILTLLLVPFTVLADPLILLRTAVEADLLNISDAKKVKLSATLKMDKNGDMVIHCFSLFAIPLARTPFAENSGIQKLVQRTQLNVEPKGRGVLVKLSFSF